MLQCHQKNNNDSRANQTYHCIPFVQRTAGCLWCVSIPSVNYKLQMSSSATSDWLRFSLANSFSCLWFFWDCWLRLFVIVGQPVQLGAVHYCSLSRRRYLHSLQSLHSGQQYCTSSCGHSGRLREQQVPDKGTFTTVKLLCMCTMRMWPIRAN